LIGTSATREDSASAVHEGGVQVSVIMTLRVSGNPDKLEQFAQANPEMISGISSRAQAAGAIAHRFYGSDGQIMVIDEWPDAASFHAFFEAEQAESAR
jgi:quinol monooxygenase YgiN